MGEDVSDSIFCEETRYHTESAEKGTRRESAVPAEIQTPVSC